MVLPLIFEFILVIQIWGQNTIGGRETDYSSGEEHKRGGLDDNELDGLEWLETAFEELRSHMTKA